MLENTQQTAERLLWDYGRQNAQGSKLTMVNHLVNMPHLIFNSTMLRQLEKNPFTDKINEDTNKHLQSFPRYEFNFQDRKAYIRWQKTDDVSSHFRRRLWRVVLFTYNLYYYNMGRDGYIILKWVFSFINFSLEIIRDH